MAATERPQTYLITPGDADDPGFADRLAAVLDRVPVACLRLALATREEDRLGRAADALRAVAHARDVAIVIENHVLLASRHGLDGVHLSDSRGIRAARIELGKDAIVGAWGGISRHDGLTAAEAGADYVSFGPVSGALGDGRNAPLELFAWWSEMIEVPCVAEGGLDPEVLPGLAAVTDFLAFGEEIWRRDDPAAELQALLARF